MHLMNNLKLQETLLLFVCGDKDTFEGMTDINAATVVYVDLRYFRYRVMISSVVNKPRLA